MTTKREHAEIRKRSEICFQSFTEISHSAQVQRGGGTYDHVISGLIDTFSRFRLWISNIGVFADDQLSLDYRVREVGEIKELFLGQLGIIECRLLQFHEMFSKSTSEDDTFVARNSSDLNASRRDIVPTTTTHETSEPDPFKEWSSEELLASIHRSIDWLQRLSNSIRRASSTSQNASAKYFKIEDYKGDKQASESEVRGRYKAMIHDISPDAPTTSNTLEKHVIKHLQQFALLSLDIPEQISSQTTEPKKSPTHQSSIASRSLDFSTDEEAAESEAETRETVKLFRQEWEDHLAFNDENKSIPDDSMDTMDTLDPDFMDYTNSPPPELLDDQMFELDWKVVQDSTEQRSVNMGPERSDQPPLPAHQDTPRITIPRISIDGQSDYEDESTDGNDTDATRDDFPIPSETDEALDLEDRIWQKAVNHANGATPSFWPPGVLKRIITRQAVTNEILKAFPNYSRKEGESIAERVWEDRSGKCVKIFTILVLLDEVQVLVEHILGCPQGVRDHDLPLTLRNKHGSPSRKLCRADSETRRLAVPVFRFDRRNNAIIHLDLDEGDILPWCEEAVVPPVNAMDGGYGTVTRVKIHPRCHEFHDTLRAINVAGGLFAVKRLRQRIVNQFRDEVDALKRFNGKVHPHLVTLLATFTQAEYYCMIFPWAECDLEQYWENNPQPDPGDIELGRWLSRQCLGIMEAVNVIHNPSHLKSERKFGRHGDIKAENILWFKSRPDDPTDRGTLVISDLGLTAMNSEKSRSMQPNTGLKMTPSYRPPECDIKGGTISRSFDIWTLGCLYLELMCWLLRGNAGKIQFDQARTAPFIFGTKADIYFDIEERKQTTPGMFVFKVKDVVSKTISELHDDPYCSRWVHDLLDLVENDMLVVLSKTHKRKTSQFLLHKLRAMDDKVQSSAGYSTGPAPQSRTPYWRPQVGTFAELNEVAQKYVLEHGVRTHESDERPLEQSEDLAELDY
ncbi:hypothetical protein INS49_002473 [Diaporthe citri]|uniref:uncharacterized protein n=1 Tax=Diaporthe citri TaxID=83186 RepID=UPI001C812456|nr:uncharacterized protein INS49_002473 [Diaporthe citri]KAG6368270.1 hypothetical protein INS49_002473 [Diaporthe citri]